MERCPECGLPFAECNALALARREVEVYLRKVGYGYVDARERADELVYRTKKGPLP